MEKLQALLTEWTDLRGEVRHYMFMLDVWVIVILVLLLVFLWAARQDLYKDAIVAAAIIGAISTVWIGRIDVLIHRPVPAIKTIEADIDALLAHLDAEPETKNISFRGWESYYKARIKTGVKVLVPLDLLAGLFLFALFMHANNSAYNGHLADWTWRTSFWWGCLAVHLIGWGIIAAAKPLAE